MQMDNGDLAGAKSMTDGIKDTALGMLVQMRVAQKQWFSDYGDGNDALPREKCFYKATLPEDVAGGGPDMQAAGGIIGFFGNDAYGGDITTVDTPYQVFMSKTQVPCVAGEAVGAGAKHDVFNVLLGEMLYRRGLENFPAARESLEKCEDKKSWFYLSRSADLERMQGNYDSAIAQFLECRALIKNDCWVRTRLLECYLQSGKYDDGLSLLKELVKDAQAQGGWMGNNKKAGGNTPLIDEGKLSAALLSFYEPFCRWTIATMKEDKAGAQGCYDEMLALYNGLGAVQFPSEVMKEEFPNMPLHFGLFWFHKIYNAREEASEGLLDEEFLSAPKDFVTEGFRGGFNFTHDIGISFFFLGFALSIVYPTPEMLSFLPDVGSIIGRDFRPLGNTREDVEILASMASFHDCYSKMCDQFVCTSAASVFNTLWTLVDSNMCINGMKHLFHTCCGIIGDPNANSLITHELLTLKGDKPLKDLLFDQLGLSMKLMLFSNSRLDVEDLDQDINAQTNLKNTWVVPLLKQSNMSCFMLAYMADLLHVDGRVRVALPMYQEALRQFPDEAKGRETMVCRMVACGFHCRDMGMWPAVIRYYKKWMRAFVSCWDGFHWIKASDYHGYQKKLENHKEGKKPAKSNLLTRVMLFEEKDTISELFAETPDYSELGDRDRIEAYRSDMGDPSEFTHKGYYKGAYAMALCRSGMFFTMTNESIYFNNMDFESNRTAATAYLTYMLLAREVSKVGTFKGLSIAFYKKDPNNPVACAFYAAAMTTDGKKKVKEVHKGLEGVASNMDEYLQNDWLDIWDAHLAAAVAGAVSCQVEGGDPSRFYDMCDGELEAGKNLASLIIKNTWKSSESGSLTKAMAPVWKVIKVYWWKDGNDAKMEAFAAAAGVSVDDPLMQLAKQSTSPGAAGFPQFQFDLGWMEANMNEKPYGLWPPTMTDVDPIDMWSDELTPFPYADLIPLVAEGHSEVTGVFTKREAAPPPADDGAAPAAAAAAPASAPAQSAPPAAAEEKKEDSSAPAAPSASPAPPTEEKKEVEPAAAASAPAQSKPAKKSAAPAAKKAAPSSSPAPARAAPARSGGGGGSAGPVSVVPAFVQSTRPLVEVPKPTKSVDELLAEFGPDKIRSFVSAQERKIASYRKTRRALVAYWNSDSVGEFIEALPFYGGWADYYSYLLRKKGVTGTDLLNATNVSTIQSWGIEDIGHQMRLLSEILKMRLRG